MKTIIKQIGLTATLSILCLGFAYSQESKKTSTLLGLRRNAIYVSAGVGVMEVSASAYYERIIGKGIPSLKAETLIRIGRIGGAGYRSANILALDVGLLVNSRLPHIAEFVVGLHPGLDEGSDFLPIGGSVAYRYQRSNGRFIFRCGAGYPESIFLSLGFSF